MRKATTRLAAMAAGLTALVACEAGDPMAPETAAAPASSEADALLSHIREFWVPAIENAEVRSGLLRALQSGRPPTSPEVRPDARALAARAAQTDSTDQAVLVAIELMLEHVEEIQR